MMELLQILKERIPSAMASRAFHYMISHFVVSGVATRTAISIMLYVAREARASAVAKSNLKNFI